jgi:hypothetical protein
MRPALRNHALRPQPDVALALFLVVPPDDMGCGVRGAAAFRAQSSAGFGVWGAGAALRKRLRLGSPGAWGPKNQGVFGVPRVCAMKNPARFPGPGLDTLPNDIFLYMNPVSTSRSHKLRHAEVVFGIPRSICRAPHRWRPSNEKPGAVSRPGFTFQACSFVLSSYFQPRVHPPRFEHRFVAAQVCLVAQEQNPAAIRRSEADRGRSPLK